MASEVGELVRAAAGGDEAAWGELVDRFASVVWARARSVGLSATAAADVSQTTWLRLAEHLGTLREPDRLAGWLAVTAHREAVRVARLEARMLLVDPWTELAGLSTEEDPVARLVETEQTVVLLEALGQMPTRCRELLAALAGDPPKTYEELARQLDMPIGSIGPTRARCLARLRALVLEAENSDYEVAKSSRSSE